MTQETCEALKKPLSPWENSRSEVKVDDAMLQELVRQIVGRLM